jgi:hypothetical protein
VVVEVEVRGYSSGPVKVHKLFDDGRMAIVADKRLIRRIDRPLEASTDGTESCDPGAVT